MKVEQLMTTDVVTVAPETSLKQVATLLARGRIAGVPVCAPDGTVLGVVSEADILWKEVALAEARGGIVDRLLDSAYGRDERAGALTAGEAMTAPAITVTPSDTAACAAERMLDHRVNRLPVVKDGRLVGIIARADLVRAFVRTDADIAAEISDDVLLHTLWVDPASVSVTVADGKVTVAGEVENRTTAELVDAYIRRVPGVVSVRSDLSWQLDDRSRSAVTPSHYVDGVTTY
jgi:CBS domain-containing protein